MVSTLSRRPDGAEAKSRRPRSAEPRTDAVLRRALMVMVALAAVTLPFGRSVSSSSVVFALSEALMVGILVALWRRWASPLTVMRWATVAAMVLMTVGVNQMVDAVVAGDAVSIGMRLVAYGTIVSGLAMLVFGPLRGAVVSLATQALWAGLLVPRLWAGPEFAAGGEAWVAGRYNILILVLLWGVVRTNAMLREERDRLRAAARRERLRGEQRQQQEEELARELAEVAHELRSPLSTIATGTEILATWGADLDERARGRVIETLCRASDRLDQRMMEFLATARDPAAAGPLHRESVDVAEVVATTLDELQLLTSEHEVRLDVPAGTEARLDPDGLDHIVTNLVENATKYVPAGGCIDVSVRRDEDTTVLVVADDGPGVPPEAREHLFTPYVRAGRGDAADGSGVGLAVVRSWVRRHDGDVRVLDTDVGAAFEVRLPDGPQQ